MQSYAPLYLKIFFRMLKKTLLIIGLLLMLLIAAAVAIPFLFKDRIVERVRNEANKQLNATLYFDNDISLGIFRSFPNLSLGLKEVTLTTRESFAGDTLLYVPQMNLTLDIMTVIRGEDVAVKQFSLNKPRIFLHVLKDGTANWDVVVADTTAPLTEPDAKEGDDMRIALEHYKINKGYLVYLDESLPMKLTMHEVDHEGSGDLTQDILDFRTRTTSPGVTVNYGGIDYLSGADAELDAVINMDIEAFKFAFKDNELRLNQLYLNFDGWLAMPEDDIDMDLTFKAKETSFKNLLSMIPAIYQKDFEQLEASGQMAFNGHAKGIYNDNSIPAFHIDLNVKDGMFKYPDLPNEVRNVQLVSHMHNPGGKIEQTVVNVELLHLEMANQPFDARIKIEEAMGDPLIDADIKGKLVLDELQNIMKLDEGTEVGGLVDVDLALNGRMSSLENEQYEKFNAKGAVLLTDVKYFDTEMPEVVQVNTATLNFTPQKVLLQNMDVRMGESDLKVEGSFNNLLSYMMKDSAVLDGALNISSNYLNLNPWMQTTTTEDAQTGDTASIEAIELPGNINFAMSANMKKVIYDNLELNNVSGMMQLNDKVLNLLDLTMNTLGGTFTASGSYNTQNPRQPKTEMDLKISTFDIASTFQKFVTVQQFVPIAQQLNGEYSANLRLETALSNEMMPQWETFYSKGKLNIQKAVLENFPVLQKLAEQLKMPEFRQLVVTGIRPSYVIENGRFFLDTVNFTHQNSAFKVWGSNGIDKSLDYMMRIMVPAQEMKSLLQTQLKDVLRQDVDLPVGEKLPVMVKIGGSFDNPTVSLDLKETQEALVKGFRDKVTETLKQKVDEKKDEVKEKITEEADKQKEELERQKAEAERKAREEMERQKEEADRKAKEEIERKKKEAEKKLKDVFGPK